MEQAINDKILSLNYEDCTAEIKNADAQESYEKGVIVLVTGCLTGKDNVKKKFSQTFFLAPQDKGYFVLNDVFRFVEENEPLPNDPVLSNSVNENAVPITSTTQPGWGDISEAGWYDFFIVSFFLHFIVMRSANVEIALFLLQIRLSILIILQWTLLLHWKRKILIMVQKFLILLIKRKDQ